MIVAAFYASPATTSAPTNIYAGAVSANGTILQYQTPYNIYTDSTHLVNIHHMAFSATGAGTVTAFSYSYTPVYPELTSPIVLADTCVKSNGINISVPSVNNLNTSIHITIYQGTSTNISKYINSASGGTVTFSASDLTGFVGDYPITIVVSLYNLQSNATVGSAVYGISSGLTYQRFCYLKN